jgi:hypothetical protein
MRINGDADSRRSVLGIALPIVCLVLAAKPAAAGAPAPVTVPMELISGRPSILLRLDGQGPYRFLFDTGSGAGLILDQGLANELALEPTGTRRIGDPNTPEAIEAQVETVGRVEVGGLSIPKVEAISWKRDVLGGADAPRGVVGLGLFAPRAVTLDYPGGKLTVESTPLPEADGRTVLVATFDDGIPSIPIDVGGKPFRAHVDSGSTGFIGLPIDVAPALALEGLPVRVGRARSATGDYMVSEARLSGTLRVGSLALDKPTLRFSGLPQANLGSDFFRTMSVTVDSANRRVRLIAAGPPLGPSERPRFGIVSHGMKEGRFPVEDVAPGSAAEAAGLKAGDEIVRLNDRAVSEMSPFQLSQALLERPLVIALMREGAPKEIRIDPRPASAQHN